MSQPVYPTSTNLNWEVNQNLDDALMQTENVPKAPISSSQVIATKIIKGIALCPVDWEWLQSLHNDPSQWDRHQVPHLNRDYLDALASVGTGPGQQKAFPQLVRHVGMVQDMLEPEYYVEEHEGQSMHFRDLSSVLQSSISHDENDESRDKDRIGSASKGMPELGSQLAERQPLLVVPLPFASDWSIPRFNPPTHSSLISSSGNDNTTTSALIPESPPPITAMEEETTCCKKRDRQSLSPSLEQVDNKALKHDFDEIDHSENHRRRRKEEPPALAAASSSSSSSPGGMVHGQESDWWPAGCCESSVRECPVLAKFAYDQYPSTSSCNHKTIGGNIKNDKRLRLNDVVELIGIVSLDPWEANQCHQNDDPFTADLFDMDCCSLPPPSRLPRLHVLSYKRLDIDSVAANAKEESLDPITDKEGPEGRDEYMTTTVVCGENFKQQLQTVNVPSNSKSPLETWEQHCKVDPIMAKALFLTLLSKAERVYDRKQKSENEATNELRSEMARAPQHALGCASLQLLCDCSSESHQLYRGLLRFLKEVCPVVAGIDMVALSPTVAKYFGESPSKETGRLEPSPWQLPRGATLILHMPGQSKKSSSTASQLQPILRELIGHHRLPYKFEGGMYVPFEADYRIIVVTWASKSTAAIASDASSTSFPNCTLQVRVPSLSPDQNGSLGTSNSISIESGMFPSFQHRTAFPRNPRTLRVLRDVVLRARSSMGNVFLPKAVLDQAQEDFLQRRARGHESKYGNMPSSSGSNNGITTLKPTLPPPEEVDFHRWLTLTRLWTRARCVEKTASSLLTSAPLCTSTVTDWQAALELDDAIQERSRESK